MSKPAAAAAAPGAPDARKINADTFDAVWSGAAGLKLRFQYNIEAARKAFLAALRDLGVPRHGQRVLDVGFGGGTLLFCFDRSCALVGTEFSRAAIAAAAARARRDGYRHLFVVPESTGLPFASEAFDLVVASHVVEHVPDDIALVAEMLRVVRPGGWLVILLPLEGSGNDVRSDPDLFNPEFLAGRHYHVRHYNVASALHRFSLGGARVALARPDMWLWDWKRALDGPRQRLCRSAAGRVLDAGIAAVLNVPLSLLPWPLLRRLDQWMSRRGYEPRQVTIALHKNEPAGDPRQ